MRVLPRVHEEINEEWISDKTRHAFDGLKRQRLNTSMKRNKDGTYEDAFWEDVIQTISKKCLSTPSDQIGAIIGEFADIESITALKDFLNRLDVDNFEVRQTGNLKVSPDFRANYLMNSRITGVEEADVLLLVGCNPRYEAPVLNARILKSTRKNLKVFNIGTNQDLNYKNVHLGSSTKVLSEIAAGTHPFAERLKKAKLPMILVGANALEREDGAELYNTLK